MRILIDTHIAVWAVLNDFSTSTFRLWRSIFCLYQSERKYGRWIRNGNHCMTAAYNKEKESGSAGFNAPERVCGRNKHFSLRNGYVMMKKNRMEEADMDLTKFQWTREPESYRIGQDQVEIITKPHTDLWQRTYYHFQNDNAPVLQMETEEAYFSFVVKTDFTESHHRFDQCGIVMYLDSENWLKGSVEYENEKYQHLGSVVTNNGYSDWATTAIDASVKSMWYRFSRREDDYCIECSTDGMDFSQMRICHMHRGKGAVRFGIYACSPEDSSFRAVFSNIQMMECQWKAHDGQQPDIV